MYMGLYPRHVVRHLNHAFRFKIETTADHLFHSNRFRNFRSSMRNGKFPAKVYKWVVSAWKTLKYLILRKSNHAFYSLLSLLPHNIPAEV